MFKTIQDYDGKIVNAKRIYNPYLIKLKKKYQYSKEINDFDQEYIDNSLNYVGDSFPTMEVVITKEDEKRIQEVFNTTKEIKTVKINKLWGMTDKYYHVAYNKYDFFIEKSFDIYHTIFNKYPVDFKKTNELFKYNLYPHQKLGVKFILRNKKCLLFDSAGAGKTFTSISASIEANAEKVLVICLSGNKTNWGRELSAFGKENDFKIINGQKNWDDSDKQYTIINFDILAHYCETNNKGERKRISELYRPLVDEKYDFIIIDEIHRAKHLTTKISKTISVLTSQPHVEYVVGMTATPIEKNEDLWNTCQSMNLNISDVISGSYFNRTLHDNFIERYCYGFKIKMRKGGKEVSFWKRGKKINGVLDYSSNTKELNTRISMYKIRRTLKELFPDFPDIYRNVLYYSLPIRQQKKYDKLYDEYASKNINVNDDARHLVESILMREYLAKCMCKNTYTLTKNNVKDGQKVIIFTHFDVENETLKKAFDKDKNINAEFVSASDNTDIQEKIDRFQNDEKCNVIFGNIKTLGTGHNITKGDVIIFNSINWNSGEHEQAEGRAWRIGREEDVEVYYMIFENTKSEEVYEKSYGKKQNKLKFYGYNEEPTD